MLDRDRFRGCLLGLACGDALGTTLEFTRPGGFEPISDMVGGGPFRLAAGQWTDDTSMALCLAESLVEKKSFDARDQMERYVRWRSEGYLSSTGTCFDIGGATARALHRFEVTGDPYSGSTDEETAGNGSLMRLAPVAMAFAGAPPRAVEMAAASSRTTHGATECVDACRYMAALLAAALAGVRKEALLADRCAPAADLWARQPLAARVDAVAAGSFISKNPPEIRGAGYVVESLEAALWAFDRGTSFRECCLLAVNLGNDADTTGAICGQLAGAYCGEQGIPEEWRERVVMNEKIVALADGLYDLARSTLTVHMCG
jgi:ADP-ribosylglycohydrolase